MIHQARWLSQGPAFMPKIRRGAPYASCTEHCTTCTPSWPFHWHCSVRKQTLLAAARLPACSTHRKHAPHKVHWLRRDGQWPPAQLVGSDHAKAEVCCQLLSWEVERVEGFMCHRWTNAVKPASLLLPASSRTCVSSVAIGYKHRRSKLLWHCCQITTTAFHAFGQTNICGSTCIILIHIRLLLPGNCESSPRNLLSIQSIGAYLQAAA